MARDGRAETQKPGRAGDSVGPRPCRPASALSSALTRAWAPAPSDTLQSATKVPGTASACRGPLGGGLGSLGAARRTAGSGERGDVWPGIPEGAEGPGGDERPGTDHSLRKTSAAGSQAGPLPLWVAPGRAGPVALGQAAEAVGGAGWGLFPVLRGSAPLCCCRGGQGAPTRPAPLAGSGHQGKLRPEGPVGCGARGGQPEGKASQARGDFPVAAL